MDISKYPPSNQLRRASDILRLLFSNGATGLAPAAISTATGLSSSYVTQQLAQLANLHMVEEVGDTGRWRAGVAWARMAIAMQTTLSRDAAALEEYRQRVTGA